MPNWVEGKLKIRGKPEDIKRWVEECLHCYTTNWLGDGAHTELVKGAVRFERDPDSEEMYLYVDKSAHIEGTRRNLVEKGEYVDLCEEGKKSILVVNMKAAWNIEEQPYIEMSKKYNLDFRVYGYEMGMEFNKEIEIVEGEIATCGMTKEETIAATMERAYRAGVIGRAEMFKIKIMLIAHNAYKFQGCAQIYRNYLPQHIAIHVRKQYLAELNRKRKGGRNAQGDSH